MQKDCFTLKKVFISHSAFFPYNYENHRIFTIRRDHQVQLLTEWPLIFLARKSLAKAQHQLSK